MTPSPRDADSSGGQPVRRVGHGVNLAICLPRDALSVPVIRHLVRYALDQVGVLDAISSDIEIALTEACANVLDHAGPGDSYDVSVAIGPDSCELRVIDVGHGFDHATVQSESRPHDMDAERGRGLRLMHALVDHIELTSAPEEGTLVHLVKRLAFDDSTPAQRLLFQALHHGHRLVSTDPAPYQSETTKPTPTAQIAGKAQELDQPTSSPQSREPDIATYPHASLPALPPRQDNAEEQ